MTYERGAGYCLKRGMHSWRKIAAGVEECKHCTELRVIELTLAEAEAYAKLLDELR